VSHKSEDFDSPDVLSRKRKRKAKEPSQKEPAKDRNLLSMAASVNQNGTRTLERVTRTTTEAMETRGSMHALASAPQDEEGSDSCNHGQDNDKSSDFEDDEQSGATGSLSGRRMDISLSTMAEDAVSIFDRETYNADNDTMQIILKDGDSATIIGHYDLYVSKGAVTVSGAILHASTKHHRIYSPSSHPLLTIQHMWSCFGQENQAAHILIRSCRPGIRRMWQISPKFGNLWNSRMDGSETASVLSNFSWHCLMKSGYDPLSRNLAPALLDPEWKTLLIRLIDKHSSDVPRILVCGPKNSGKSAFCRSWTNRAVTTTHLVDGIALLDLDPGQPEYSAPGEVSLVHVRDANLAPPFCHPLLPPHGASKVIRSHHIGSTTPRNDIQHYLQCAMDLMDTYEREIPKTPLIINTCGWITGSGLDILTNLIATFGLTDVIYTSRTGPRPVLEKLVRSSVLSGAEFHTVESLPVVGKHLHASDARMMQTLSYFHAGGEGTELHWNPSSVNSMATQKLYYAGSQQDIHGIMVLEEGIHPSFVSGVIEGGIVALVLAEDDSVFAESAREIHPEETEDDMSRLPYINSSAGIGNPLNPKSTRSIGQAFVRGISHSTQSIEIITPVPKKTFDSYREQGLKLVLVKGKLDAPSWAYQEELYETEWLNRNRRAIRNLSEDDQIVLDNASARRTDSESQIAEEQAEVEDVVRQRPWISLVKSDGLRRDKVWKVRRNLVTGAA
jgi:polynucleotide 5'-hydroxyl-kinase GRC3/NOL9